MLSQICVVSVTYYTDASDIRFTLAQQLCRLAHQKQINLIVVDDSPIHIREKIFQEQGGCVQILAQDNGRYQGKGGALRQAIDHARIWFQEHQKLNLNRCVICFTEPEKVDLLNHIQNIVTPIISLDQSADVVVPLRNRALFQETYPVEQYHSESFANLHFDSLAKRHVGFQTTEIMERGLDWLFGPFAFNARLACHWLEYTGMSWDAQMIPYVRGVLHRGWRIQSVEVHFKHPPEMKLQEEGNPVWTSKRLHQLNVLFELLGKAELT
ncbi:hypothetical protein HJC23_010087 [Cyclotella cryptica]|uniref:Glycosyltransferase 2-like domain-containing protein n=1 Tax=Cyclotella cryptica TaxID=29204 RepID=A0ABD3Q400_9STRA|eukprot:CCRYP_009078-RA/>CCRYP_009078-RA protein AED:0.40 eAED:0.39 QI:0/-1/0/1/-1/1/1/0/267